MKLTPLEHKIERIVDPVIKDLGFDLVQVRLIGSQKLQTLQILAENPATGTIDLNGCTAVSRAVSAVLDVEDPIPGAYQLEVSSPGVDRPLTKPSDFVKYKGLDISVETDVPNENNQKRFKGILNDFSDDVITLKTESGEVKIDLGDISKAKLVMTEQLATGKVKGQKKNLNPKKTNKQSKPQFENQDELESEEL